jgi:hypothetical protein
VKRGQGNETPDRFQHLRSDQRRGTELFSAMNDPMPYGLYFRWMADRSRFRQRQKRGDPLQTRLVILNMPMFFMLLKGAMPENPMGDMTFFLANPIDQPHRHNLPPLHSEKLVLNRRASGVDHQYLHVKGSPIGKKSASLSDSLQ